MQKIVKDMQDLRVLQVLHLLVQKKTAASKYADLPEEEEKRRAKARVLLSQEISGRA